MFLLICARQRTVIFASRYMALSGRKEAMACALCAGHPDLGHPESKDVRRPATGSICTSLRPGLLTVVDMSWLLLLLLLQARLGSVPREPQ